MIHLPRVRTGLLNHQLEDQAVVYDPQHDKVHLLDPPTACVLSLLQDGNSDAEAIEAELLERFGVPATADFLTMAIDELRLAGLLAEPEKPVDMSRRDLVRKAALASAASLLIPAIITFTATPGYAAGSATGSVGTCGHCITTADCATGTCGNATFAACGSNKIANGGPCSGNSQGNANAVCCSGNCSSPTNGTCQP